MRIVSPLINQSFGDGTTDTSHPLSANSIYFLVAEPAKLTIHFSPKFVTIMKPAQTLFGWDYNISS
jgi:hypothetical protein